MLLNNVSHVEVKVTDTDGPVKVLEKQILSCHIAGHISKAKARHHGNTGPIFMPLQTFAHSGLCLQTEFQNGISLL